MSSTVDELVGTAERLASRTPGMAVRFDEACRKAGVQSVRQYRLEEMERFFSEIHQAVEEAKAIYR